MKDIIIYLIPIIVLQLTLQIYGLIKILKTKNFKFLSKVWWFLIVLIGGIIGAIFYFLLEGEE